MEGFALRSLTGEDALPAVETPRALMHTALFVELEQLAADEQPALIVLDRMVDVFPANENDRARIRQSIGNLRGLVPRQRCAVMLPGHPSRTGLSGGRGSGMSGMTARNGSARSRMGGVMVSNGLIGA